LLNILNSKNTKFVFHLSHSFIHLLFKTNYIIVEKFNFINFIYLIQKLEEELTKDNRFINSGCDRGSPLHFAFRSGDDTAGIIIDIIISLMSILSLLKIPERMIVIIVCVKIKYKLLTPFSSYINSTWGRV
jgi:hypothetical protein